MPVLHICLLALNEEGTIEPRRLLRWSSKGGNEHLGEDECLNLALHDDFDAFP